MADNPANDPFTRAFDAIQSACANHAPLAALVKADDRINLRVINEVPRKESEDDGDWPEQFLKITGFNGDLFEASSLSCKFSATYSMQISSGIMTVEGVCRVWWETIRALYFAGPHLGLSPLVQRYSVHRASPVRLGEYVGTEQWYTVLNISVFFAMGKDTLAAYPAQTLTT